MNIENIEAFVYVNHYGSFNKAAEVLFLSQPSVTARIQTLERELDCKVFDRLGKQIALTEKGKQFLPYAQQIMQTFQKGKLHMQQRKTVPHELRIGATVSVSNYLIPSLLPRLKQRYPEIHIKLTTSSTDDLVNKLLNKEIDLAFVRKVVHPSLISYKFYEDPIKLYVYEGHPFTQKSSVSIEEIGFQPLVFFECGSLDWMRVHRVFDSLDRQPNIEYFVDNSESAKKLVLERAGICFLPGLCVEEEVREEKLFPIDFEEVNGITLQTNLIARNGEHAMFAESLMEIGESLFG
ncbi:LysR family transcriptional regulator [Paenibacillus sacheonensis]|uniref:LysR family transcriptional regulator n=1 Tax=Paenibacillus sacheonensis TaxID=742054 RepID=A0A7X4YU89_9BACL|nr:LysR family transcriptional regulator [Paenibacillus sacheonensis]MBM7566748.1 DNA-binding transcriptional LysR family regulator [Paenibacillus sacheonensis]NBC71676.1 LysR family transcriptional regulator [Paenibacillus sacheonensis]